MINAYSVMKRQVQHRPSRDFQFKIASQVGMPRIHSSLSSSAQRRKQPRSLSGLLLFVTAAVFLGAVISAEAQSNENPSRRIAANILNAGNVKPQAQLRRLSTSAPLSFEANQGQTNPSVNFISHGPGYTLFLTSTEAVFTFRKFEFVNPSPRKRPFPPLPSC